MHPGHHDRGNATIYKEGFGRGRVLAEIPYPARDVLWFAIGHAIHVADVDEALFALEIVDDVQRGEASIPGDLREP
jgi:hypothetical protein